MTQHFGKYYTVSYSYLVFTLQFYWSNGFYYTRQLKIGADNKHLLAFYSKVK